MTTPSYNPNLGLTPWGRYQESEAIARDIYLKTVSGAHVQYLTGPWPDRTAYEAVERSAWQTYYHDCRTAWQKFVSSFEPQQPPPSSNPYPPARAAGDGLGWPNGQGSRDQPVYTPHDGGNQ